MPTNNDLHTMSTSPVLPHATVWDEETRDLHGQTGTLVCKLHDWYLGYYEDNTFVIVTFSHRYVRHRWAAVMNVLFQPGTVGLRSNDDHRQHLQRAVQSKQSPAEIFVITSFTPLSMWDASWPMWYLECEDPMTAQELFDSVDESRAPKISEYIRRRIFKEFSNLISFADVFTDYDSARNDANRAWSMMR
jgi:hypothetical protein